MLFHNILRGVLIAIGIMPNLHGVRIAIGIMPVKCVLIAKVNCTGGHLIVLNFYGEKCVILIGCVVPLFLLNG